MKIYINITENGQYVADYTVVSKVPVVGEVFGDFILFKDEEQRVKSIEEDVINPDYPDKRVFGYRYYSLATITDSGAEHFYLVAVKNELDTKADLEGVESV